MDEKLHVLIVGMTGFGREEYILSLANKLREICSDRTITMSVAPNFKRAIKDLKAHDPEVVHLVNETGIERLRYCDGCEQVASFFDGYARKPFVSIASIDMLHYLRPTFERHNIKLRYYELREAVRTRWLEDWRLSQ